jgi:hypothetical protein
MKSVGIGDTAKWLQRLSTMSLDKFRLTFIVPGGLLPGDTLTLEEAVGLAIGQPDWAYAIGLGEQQGRKASDVNEPPNDATRPPPSHGLPIGSRRLMVGVRPAHFDFDTVGAFKLSREFSCFLASVAAASVSAKATWYPKVLRALAVELGPLVGYHLDKKHRATDLKHQVPRSLTGDG